MAFHGDRVRVLVIPGLHDSGPTHWQSRLQAHFRHSVRVQQQDWATPDLNAWAERIDATLAAQPPARWVAIAHSFGCLALLHHLATREPNSKHHQGVQSALLVAPADPDKFGDAGHINVASGFGPLPLATSVAQQLIHRAERQRRIERSHALEWSFAI